MDNQESVFASSTNATAQDDNVPMLSSCHLGRIKILQTYIQCYKCNKNCDRQCQLSRHVRKHTKGRL